MCTMYTTRPKFLVFLYTKTHTLHSKVFGFYFTSLCSNSHINGYTYKLHAAVLYSYKCGPYHRISFIHTNADPSINFYYYNLYVFNGDIYFHYTFSRNSIETLPCIVFAEQKKKQI